MRLFIASLLIAVGAWAGQSLNGGTSLVAAVPTLDTGEAQRLEYMIHDWPDSSGAASRPVKLNAAGMDCYLTGTPLILTCPATGTNVGFTINGTVFATFPTKRMYIRHQFCPADTTMRLEAWDASGVLRYSTSTAYTVVNTGSWSGGANGVQFRTDASLSVGIAFARIHSTCLPLNSRPPTTVDDVDRRYEWKFDGSLTAATGGINATGTSPTYVDTPDQNAYSLPRVKATEWSNWTSLRAGATETLTGSESYSQADASNTVTCLWQITSKPTGAPMPVLSNHATCDPTISGTVFGGYTAQLTVTDVVGSTSTVSLEFGAVATDSNGVVVPSDSTLENVLGPMIALGRNPWGYADDTHLRGMAVRSAYYDSIGPPSWATPLDGTVDYVAKVTQAKGTLAVAVSSTTQATITLNSDHSIDLTDFPTVISIGGAPGSSSAAEEILIASAAGNVLTVANEGRGWRNTTPRTAVVSSNVWQNKATGTGTAFLTDFCPAGQGAEGQITYSTGTVALTAGSTTVTGSGTTWNTANGVVAGRWIQLSGTSGGQPFIFAAPISAVGSTTSITLSRAYPATASNISGVTYSIIAYQGRSFTPNWTRPDMSEGKALFGVSFCASDTSLYFNGGLEVYEGTQEEKPYAQQDTTSLWITSQGNGTPNFYDEVAANYALWLRSGYEPARVAARKIGDYWLQQPTMDEGWGEPFPRNASVLGPVLAALTDSRSDNWYGIRKLASKGVLATLNTGCTDGTRENAYELMWLAFAANYDPVDTGNPADPDQRSYWKAKLADSYTRDNGCKRADNSFANGAEWSPGAAMSVTSGSRTVTSPTSAFTTATCARTAGGTGTIVNGAGSFTVSTGTPVAGEKILLTGTRSGQPYNVYMQFSGTSTVQLSGTWLGDTGTIDWQTESDGNWTMYHDGSTLSEGDQGEMYGCRYISASEIELNRPWTGSTTSNLRSFRFNIPGWGMQPFILGIKALQMKVAAAGATGSTATNYLALAQAAATWIRDTGYDPVTKGLFVARIYQNCEPAVAQGDLLTASYRQMQCAYASNNPSAARALSAEAQNGLSLWYQANPTSPNQATGDDFYAANWGYQYVEAGYVTDSVNNPYASDANLNVGKWYGFQFGVGMAHQWPAVRLGGVAAASPVTVGFALGAAAGETAAPQVIYTTATGVSTTVTCSAATVGWYCPGAGDRRLGQELLHQVVRTFAGGQARGEVSALRIQ